jgi:hypothetical protein
MKNFTLDDLKAAYNKIHSMPLKANRMFMDVDTAFDLGIGEAEMCDRCCCTQKRSHAFRGRMRLKRSAPNSRFLIFNYVRRV